MAREDFQQFVGGAASEFARISSAATAESNKRRLEIAGANRRAGESQIQLEARVQNREISRALMTFQGEQAAARAFRGGGALGTGNAIVDAAAAAAGEQASIVAANAAHRSSALAAQTQVILDDPVLAAIQGGIEGASLAQSILQSQIESAKVTQHQSSQQIQTTGAGGGPTIPTFNNTITSILNIPGLNLNSFLKGLDLG